MKFYTLLSLSIILETTGASFMKLADNSWIAMGIVAVCYAISLTLYITLTYYSEISVVNAIWSGVGTALIVSIGILYFGESNSYTKTLGTVLIIIGVVGLNVSTRQTGSVSKKGEA
ncbi:DMT family transporter [Sediminibacillus albus]|uniref:Small multidrug resistance pump n=1 Tax=Sediminibacillus albus TaxID=407036 RepID=A0A1G8WT63_9BACI|nr:SMR family transporter [Sediminibacillus albus]SDJ81602.1 small multidrug resistance pump [Sediminibacillus albus]